jgi:hypothetical protein
MNGPRAGVGERLQARAGSGSCRGHVVDQQDTPSMHQVTASHHERGHEVGGTRVGIEVRLWPGSADASEHAVPERRDRHTAPSSMHERPASELLALIEPPGQPTSPVQGDRYDQVVWRTVGAREQHGLLCQQTPERPRQRQRTLELERADGPTQRPVISPARTNGSKSSIDVRERSLQRPTAGAQRERQVVPKQHVAAETNGWK